MDKGARPDYERPPVVETVLGVQFERLPGFKNAHLGAFWKTLDAKEWSSVADAPPLQPQFERFTEGARWAKGLQVRSNSSPLSRLQIKNQDGNRMIQVQNGRFHFNWLGKRGGEYPRYEKVREGFDWALRQFINFAHYENTGDFRPNQWEVTYINHILQGSVWNTPDDWGFFQPLHSIPTIDKIVQGESFSGEWHFVIPEQRGRLHIGWQHGLDSSPEHEGQEVIRLTLTARGPVEDCQDATQAILDGLDLGRETIVRSFKNLMSVDANKHWGLKDARD